MGHQGQDGRQAVYDIKDLINEQLIDYVRCATTHFGGITPLKKVMAQAEPYQIKSGFHGPTDVSPIGFAAELHLDINIHNYGAQEYMTHTPETLEVFETTMTFENGMLHPSDTPGLGVTFHPEIAEKFPYEQAYLPYNRLADGTVHNW